MLSAGIDVGTSGVRAVVLDTSRRHVVAQAARPVADGVRTPDGGHRIDDDAVVDAALQVLADVARTAGNLDAVSVAGTAGTLCFRDRDGKPCAPAVAYDDSRFGGGLPRVVAWRARVPAAARVVPITDAVLEALGAAPGHTDWTNALKLGWDPRTLRWPADAAALEAAGYLPQVAPPGSRASSRVRSAGTARTVVGRGATDSCAMHIAATGLQPAAWSVSLGSTVTWKATVTGAPPPSSLDRLPPGAYAHRVADDVWLAAAASNCGGAVLAALEPGANLQERDRRARLPSGFAAYPLTRPGERFPIADPAFGGFGVPHSDDPRLHAALLEGVAFVIRLGVERLAGAGLPPPDAIHLTGGGARSERWTELIAAVLDCPLVPVPDASPALGAALLAAAAAERAPVGETATAMDHSRAHPKSVAGAGLSDRLVRSYEDFTRLLAVTALPQPVGGSSRNNHCHQT